MIGNVPGLIAYAGDRGLIIDSQAASVALFKSADYLNTKCWVGERAAKSQEDSWPRVDSGGDPIIDDGQVAGDVPQMVVNAAYRLAMEASQGVDLLPSIAGKQITQETVEGAVTVKYQESSIGAAPYFPWMDSMVGQFLDDCGSGSGFNFPVGRA